MVSRRRPLPSNICAHRRLRQISARSVLDVTAKKGFPTSYIEKARSYPKVLQRVAE